MIKTSKCPVCTRELIEKDGFYKCRRCGYRSPYNINHIKKETVDDDYYYEDDYTESDIEWEYANSPNFSTPPLTDQVSSIADIHVDPESQKYVAQHKEIYLNPF